MNRPKKLPVSEQLRIVTEALQRIRAMCYSSIFETSHVTVNDCIRASENALYQISQKRNADAHKLNLETRWQG